MCLVHGKNELVGGETDFLGRMKPSGGGNLGVNGGGFRKAWR